MFSAFSLVPVAEAAVNTAVLGQTLNPIITYIIDPLLMLAFALAVVVFTYGVIQVIIYDTEADEHEKGKRSMYYGVIGIFIMVSAWGIINLVANTVKQFH